MGVNEMPNFEVFTRRATPVGKGPLVTIQKKGTISLNQEAFGALQEPETVELLFDRDERVIGIRPVDPVVTHAYRPRKQGRSASYIIAGKAFTQYFDIPTDTARRYRAEAVDGVLTVDLKEEGVVVTGPRSKEAAAR